MTYHTMLTDYYLVAISSTKRFTNQHAQSDVNETDAVVSWINHVDSAILSLTRRRQ